MNILMVDSMVKSKPFDNLKQMISEYLIAKGISNTELKEFEDDIPNKWEKFSDVILLPNSSFKNTRWSIYRNDLWGIISEALMVKRIGINGEIIGEKRESTVDMVLGNNDWVVRKESGIKYGYMISKCMFSAGNINERKRMGDVGEKDEVVVDLYAGIGYYSIPMLVFSKIKHMHSCEWNEESVKALEINLESNNVTNGYTIHYGDNRVTTKNLFNMADRVILGLLPSAEEGYIPALNVLKKIGILHIHGIAPAKNHDKWINETLQKLQEIRPEAEISESERFRIKSYAPHWDHLVVDIKVE